MCVYCLYYTHTYTHTHTHTCMSQISQAPPPTSHSDHCHLSFNSNYLHLIKTQLNQHNLSTHLTSVSCPISLTRSGLTPTLHSYLPHDYLPHDYLPHDYLPHDYLPHDYLPPVPCWSSVSPTSACLHPSPQLFGVDPRCVLTTSSTSSWQENHH